MRVAYAIAALCFAWSGAALADDDPSTPDYTIELSVGEDYTFADRGISMPQFDESSVEQSLGFEVSRWNFSLGIAHIETENDDQGVSVEVGYSRDDACIRNLDCSLSVRWRDVDDQATVKYAAEIGGDLGLSGLRLHEPSWSVGAEAVTGDKSESAVSAGIELPFRPFNNRFEITVTAAEVYGFETGDALPQWGVELSYEFERGQLLPAAVRIGAGYESNVVLDEEDELDVERNATASLRISF